MRSALLLTLLIGVMTLGTGGLGWWVLPAVGGAWGAWRWARGSPVVEAAGAAAASWGLLLVVSARGSLAGLSGLLGETFGLPGIAVIAATLAFAALLAGSAAGLAASLLELAGRAWLADDGEKR